MFLKRLEIQGFKSFADKTIIKFDDHVVGIVGPNGCGKSNINDAIRWVLGEQSVKSLRGTSMSDVIFAGSAERKPVNMAQVTLVFNNLRRHLPIAYDEVEITRRMYRMNNENEYFINKTPCRLKDITSLIMDSGLGRDSLSVISQGNISSFAESKPEERRAIFEEAAGVAKYKKRKLESISKLERTQENLIRLEDIATELELQMKPLEIASKKALVYEEKKKELEKIEISVLVDEIDLLKEDEGKDTTVLFNLEIEAGLVESQLILLEQKNNDLREELRTEEQQITVYQNELVKAIDESVQLEKRKVELDEKRKYMLETSDAKEKAITLQSMVSDAFSEFENRELRLKELIRVEALLKNEYSETHEKYSHLTTQVSNERMRIQNISNRESVLENLIQHPFQSQQGVKAVLDAKIEGVFGSVTQLLEVRPPYELAIANSLGGAMYHLVCEHEEAARHGISFLKRNKSGRATFLPLSIIKANTVNKDTLTICESIDGFLGLANEFVIYKEKYEPLVQHLLANIVIVDTLEHGNELAARIRYSTKIITVEGDAINRGGSMSGGFHKQNNSPLTLKVELQQIKIEIEKGNQQLQNIVELQSKLEEKLELLRSRMHQTQLDMAELTPIVQVMKAKYQEHLSALEALKPYLENDQKMELANELILALNDMTKRKEELQSTLKESRQIRLRHADTLHANQNQLALLRTQEKKCNEGKHQLELQMTKASAKLEFFLERLAKTYEMTYEFAKSIKLELNLEEARQKVSNLRGEIQRLGNINLDAPQQYEEVKDRFEILDKNIKELTFARDSILQAISEMDITMEKQFLDMFTKINDELDDVFKALFGGGKASLKLVDPSDVLNTGVDIDVQPPGKAVANIRLFSGGEKALIAISVLFAILRARTVPLCIFDEVEAALDQANVERFAKYISNFSNESQFIVVTHRPGTMAQCDTLYGVTMQRNGVSEILRVKLNDALSIIEE